MAEILRYEPQQEPLDEDIENFVLGATGRLRILPFQTSPYVLRETRQALSWIKAYIACEIDDLKSDFVCKEKSFYIALIENALTGDRSISFRLATAGIAGYTEWRVSLRRVSFEGSDEYFLCAEY